MKITYLGHSCFTIETAEVSIILDPFISGNELAKEIDVDSLKVQHVVMSHGHQDHMLDAERIAKNNNAQLLGSYELVQWFGKQGYENGLPMNTGGKTRLGDITLKWVPACHSNSLPDGSYAGDAAGVLIKAEGKTLYYAGDTSLTMEMELLKRFDTPDLCILPIGDHFTMDAEDAARALDLVGCKKAIGMHYDTFPYIKIDKNEAKATFEKAGKELTLLEIGQSMDW